MRRFSCRSNGFTLIEMLVTVFVLVILLALAAPAFDKIIATQRVKNTSFDLYSALMYARSEAVKRGAAVSLRSGETTNGAWSTGWRVTDAGGTRLRGWGARTGLDVTESASLTVVTFRRDGRLTTAAPRIEIGPASALDGVSSRCVTVDLSGRPTTQTGVCP